MDLGIKGKKALVTGASRGLGRSISLALSKENVKVAIVARNEYGVSSVVNEMGGETKGHYGLCLDLSKDSASEVLKKKLDENFGQPDIIVHNLGGTLGVKDVNSGVEDFCRVWKFNVGIAVELNRLYLPYMQKNKWGRIVHISSSSAVNVDASLAYSSAKAALNVYAKGLGFKVASDGVIVTAVMPGPFRYEGGHWDNVARNFPERYEKFISEKMALKRLGIPEEISGIVVFLCSEHASYFPGSIVSADGGFH